MKFNELKIILKRLFKEYVKKHISRILIALVLSIIVALSTSGIAWLLDPAVKILSIKMRFLHGRYHYSSLLLFQVKDYHFILQE